MHAFARAAGWVSEGAGRQVDEAGGRGLGSFRVHAVLMLLFVSFVESLLSGFGERKEKGAVHRKGYKRNVGELRAFGYHALFRSTRSRFYLPRFRPIGFGQENRALDPLLALSANVQCLFEAINDASLPVRPTKQTGTGNRGNERGGEREGLECIKCIMC